MQQQQHAIHELEQIATTPITVITIPMLKGDVTVSTIAIPIEIRNK